jgi:hypothetical protein
MQVSQKDMASVKVPKTFNGSATLTGEALEEFLVRDPFYLNRIEKKLGMSTNVPKNMVFQHKITIKVLPSVLTYPLYHSLKRGNLVQGSLVLVGGRAGAQLPPEGYHCSDIVSMFPSKKFVKTLTAAEKKKQIQEEAAKARQLQQAEASKAGNSAGNDENRENQDAVHLDGETKGSAEEGTADTALEVAGGAAAGGGGVVVATEAPALGEKPAIPPPRIKYFSVTIKHVQDLSYSESEKLVCTAHVGSESLGFGGFAETTKVIGVTTATWSHRNPINTFCFPLPVPHPEDKEFVPDEREVSFKLSIFDTKSSGQITRHLGVETCIHLQHAFYKPLFYYISFLNQSIMLNQNDLYSWLRPYECAQETVKELIADPMRGMRTNGKLIVRHGIRGAR